MTDNKLVKLAGEHWVCSVMAGYGWAVALTRDGLERTDILAVHTDTRRMVEVQVKTASHRPRPNWPLNRKAQQPAKSDQEWFVLVVLAEEPAGPHRAFVVPRAHVAAAAAEWSATRGTCSTSTRHSWAGCWWPTPGTRCPGRAARTSSSATS